jgi:hypothetical protein
MSEIDVGPTDSTLSVSDPAKQYLVTADGVAANKVTIVELEQTPLVNVSVSYFPLQLFEEYVLQVISDPI